MKFFRVELFFVAPYFCKFLITLPFFKAKSQLLYQLWLILIEDAKKFVPTVKNLIWKKMKKNGLAE